MKIALIQQHTTADCLDNRERGMAGTSASR
jgi:hypothetical protein